MNHSHWKDTVHSDTVPPFLIPEYPSLGDEVTIRLRVSREAPLATVHVRAILDGIDHHVDAIREPSDAAFVTYVARFELRQAKTHYHFLLRTTDGTTFFLNRRGISTVFPTEDHDFTIDTDYEPPAWVRSAVFYQIFPDRFFRADRALGVRTGEIERGEFRSREMPWDATPLPYPEAGSLDFFNGDLPGVEAKLEYLADLGVNAIYLTPIFTAKTNHRYDCLDYFSVDAHLGGDEALASLVTAAHRRGMRVVLDVSINHIGVEHDWADGLPVGSLRVPVVQTDRDSPVHWAGVPDLLKLDYSVAELREVIYRATESVVQRYLREPFGIDGWRFDVASETGRYAREQEQGHAVWREIRRVVRDLNPSAYILGEHWHDSTAYLQGDQWDSAMNYFGSGRLVRMWCGEEDRFAVVPSREALPGRRISGHELASLIDQHFARIPSATVHTQFNLLDSHDVTRLHNNSTVFDWPIYAGGIMLLAMLPGTFSVYYGDEVGLAGTLDGDHGKRYPMAWDPDDWDERFVGLYRMMIGLK
ncbi:MAG TPA: glycoside hydrolase family 13 protein, partial [Spirochaetia bacterium]|nr:glycoside hydrolase family 13 protein [Spirochaetia bacterium]